MHFRRALPSTPFVQSPKGGYGGIFPSGDAPLPANGFEKPKAGTRLNLLPLRVALLYHVQWEAVWFRLAATRE